MYERCDTCGHWKRIVFRNRFEKLCQPCLETYMTRVKARARGEALPLEKPMQPAKTIVVDGIPIELKHDGPPHHLWIRGRKYIVCAMPSK